MYWINEILPSFNLGLASAHAAELPQIEVYDSALNFAANDTGISKTYIDEVLFAHFSFHGYPAAW